MSSKILFVNMPSYGHVNPTLALVKEFVNRGNKVFYYTGEIFKESLEKMGAEVRYKHMPKSIIKDVEPRKILEYMYDNFNLLKSIIEEKDKFDFLIFDSVYFLGNSLGKILNIKTICSHTTFALNEEMRNEVINKGSENISKSFAEFSRLKEVRTLIQKYKEIFNIDILREWQIKSRKSDLNIVYTSKLFQPNIEYFDNSYKFIGPSISNRNESTKININFKSNKKIVYIAFGTILKNTLDFYLTCFQAFQDVNCHFIISTGYEFAIDSLGEIPENFTVYKHVPQLDVLSKTDAFITHGGMNSTSEALYFGVPLIVIPQVADQPIVAEQVKKLNAGIVLDKNTINPDILKFSLEKILKDTKYRANAMLIRASFIKSGGYKNGVDEILNFVK